MNNIYICDAPCGSGKTTAAINYINESSNDEKFLYITPFLTEVQRVKENCRSKDMCEPQDFGSKIKDIKKLFSKDKNIVSTHALFNMFDSETLSSSYNHNYTLILDEVAEVIKPIKINDMDINYFLECTDIDDKGKVSWIKDETYNGLLKEYKKMCDDNCLYCYHNKFFLWMFPIDVFTGFKNIYILTYMYQSQVQKYYYDFYGVKYEYIYVKDMKFTKEKVNYSPKEYKDLITICDNKKMNSIGEDRYALTVSWYNRNIPLDDKKNIVSGKEYIASDVIINNTKNFFKNITKTQSNKNMWTCYKDYKKCLSGQGYAKGFVSINARATNDYRDKESLAYLSNVYMNPNIKNFLSDKGIQIKEDEYALSELIQWIFRSRIRDKKHIYVYIPSSRMRKLLQGWISKCSKNTPNKTI